MADYDKKVKVQVDDAESKDDFAARIAESVAKAVAQATVQVQERIAPVEKRSGTKVSFFNPEGIDPRPKLERAYIFCGAELKEKFLTNDEIAVLNKLKVPGDYHRGQWKVRVRNAGSDKETVVVELPVKDINQRMDLPRGLTAIVSEIIADQKPAA